MKSMFMKANNGAINGSADGRTGGWELAVKEKRASESSATKGYIYILHVRICA
jgi:hypothetical protein